MAFCATALIASFGPQVRVPALGRSLPSEPGQAGPLDGSHGGLVGGSARCSPGLPADPTHEMDSLDKRGAKFTLN